ncbi:ferritin-1 heavy chain-like [Lineus longissimus]|uniref:ferritin-1 heavy chain-like n=1 Tax=Lineus longissimus TaxID=88925 RepID=UPI002B4C2D1C
MSIARQNFHEATEAEMNKMINMELTAGYLYMCMGFHFDRDDVALPNLSKYFRKCSDAKKNQASQLMTYQNKRGGRLVLHDIKAPGQGAWSSHTSALEDALAFEKKMNEALQNIVVIASSHHDSDTEDFLEDEFLGKSVETMKAIADLITNSNRCADGLGTFVFDNELSD